MKFTFPSIHCGQLMVLLISCIKSSAQPKGKLKNFVFSLDFD